MAVLRGTFMAAQANPIHPSPLLRPRKTTPGRAKPRQELQSSCPGTLLADAQTLTTIQRLEQQTAQPCERVGLLVELADYKLAVGRVEQAIALLERAIRCHSQAAPPVLLLGKAWETEGEYDKALEIYLEALQRGVPSAEVEAMLFRQEFLLSTYPRCIPELTVVAARKKNGGLWRRLARVCEINSDYAQAQTFLTEAVREEPQEIGALGILARIAEKQGKMEEAARWHQRILELNPRLPVSNHFLARQHYARGEYTAALLYLAQVREKDLHYHRLYQLAWLLAHVQVSASALVEEQLEEIRQWQELTNEEQTLAQVLFLLAGERRRAGRCTGAEQARGQAVELGPAPPGAALVAAGNPRKTKRVVVKKGREPRTNEEKTTAKGSPGVAPVSVPTEFRWRVEKEWQQRPAWMGRMWPWFAARLARASSPSPGRPSRGSWGGISLIRKILSLSSGATPYSPPTAIAPQLTTGRAARPTARRRTGQS